MYFAERFSGGYGGRDIWKATRPDEYSNWSNITNLGSTVNTHYHEMNPEIYADGLTLLFDRDVGGRDLYYCQRDNSSAFWGTPQEMDAINSEYTDAAPSISSDGLILTFFSERPGGYGGKDIWYCVRASVDDPWSDPINAGPTINTAASEVSADISLIDNKIYFGRVVSGTNQLFCAEIIREPTLISIHKTKKHHQ